jgi:hypothetical protein
VVILGAEAAPAAGLKVCAKKCGFRTFWHKLALRLPLGTKVRTICRRFYAFRPDFLAAPGARAWLPAGSPAALLRAGGDHVLDAIIPFGR